ncbi:MAG TPA: RdgB/HAM1 family non-canonical purine NTP pyrophosphatase [Phycisphaerae bacterium]|nr:RdgB/HAM1 family non-canonical purine NTP pyrophosphatase [Phycisphaerae bacterium]
MPTDPPPCSPRPILIATGNPGKFREISAVLSQAWCAGDAPLVEWRSLSDLAKDLPEPVEDQATFAANATLKARYYSQASGLWTLADDSGLEVDALGGQPGVYSARYGGAPAGSPRDVVTRANNRRLIQALAGVPQEKRAARFRCALALADGNRILTTAEGAVGGQIIDQPRGSNGFGYDPHFFMPDLGKTMAELESDHKNRISHRGQALQMMRERLMQLLRRPL